MSVRELKAKKAKFGFDAGSICLNNIISHAKLLEGLKVFDSSRYNVEAAGYNTPDLKVYTDDEEVARWIRTF